MRNKFFRTKGAVFVFSAEGEFYFDKVTRNIGKDSSEHLHDRAEIYYLKEGECTYFIENTPCNIKKGDIVFVPEGKKHKTVYNLNPYTRLLINCTKKYIPESVLDSVSHNVCIYRNPHISSRIEEIMCLIEEEYTDSDEYSEEMIRALTFQLFFIFARNFDTKYIVRTGSEFIGRTINYIQQNYSKDITLTDVAQMNCVSAEHLSRSFKKETGVNFNEYVTLFRLQKAEYMLRNEPGRSVSHIAYAVGFNDSNYFSHKFKKLYGISPLKFRKGTKQA